MWYRWFRNGTTNTVGTCVIIAKRKRGKVMDYETFAKLYYVTDKGVKILVIELLREVQPQNEPQVKHSGTSDKDE